MNYLQEHDDDLKRRLVSLAHFDTTTENDELVTLLKLNFIEYPAIHTNTVDQTAPFETRKI